MLGSLTCLSVESSLWLFINLFWSWLLYSNLDSRFFRSRKSYFHFNFSSSNFIVQCWFSCHVFVSESTGWKCRGNFILNYYWSIINIPIKNDGYVWNKFHLFVFFSFQVRNIKRLSQRERRISDKICNKFFHCKDPL